VVSFVVKATDVPVGIRHDRFTSISLEYAF
jgi:hypothetical protein